MAAHVTATVRTCFAALQQIRSVRRSRATLVVSKLDYCNSVLVGVSATLQRRHQSVLNAAARLVFSAGRWEHVTPHLRELHWLKVQERIQFRARVLAYRCLHGQGRIKACSTCSAEQEPPHFRGIHTCKRRNPVLCYQV